MQLVSRPMYVVGEDQFKMLTNSKVLIYFPHGVGDWVFLSQILPYLDPSNEYFVTRIGDHNVSLFDGCEHATPIYSGIADTHASAELMGNTSHLNYNSSFHGRQELTMTDTMSNQIDRHGITHAAFLLGFPDPYLQKEAPWHSKARYNTYRYVNMGRKASNFFGDFHPTVNMTVHDETDSIIRPALQDFIGDGKLCVICPSGFHNNRRDWGITNRDGLHSYQEVRDFMNVMKENDPSWKFLLMSMFDKNDEPYLESDLLDCKSYSGLIPNDLLFGHAIKSILNLASLAVSSDTGPLHIALCRRDLPVVGVWNTCLPWNYDEPRSGFVNVISKNVVDGGFINMIGGYIADAMGADYVERYNLILSQGSRMEGHEVFDAAQKAIAQCSRLVPAS